MSSHHHRSSERILSWRSAVSTNASADRVVLDPGHDRTRSASPRTPTLTHRPAAAGSTPRPSPMVPSTAARQPPLRLRPDSSSPAPHPPPVTSPDSDPDPMMLEPGGQSLAFWNVANWTKAGRSGAAVPGGGGGGGGGRSLPPPPPLSLLSADTGADAALARPLSQLSLTSTSSHLSAVSAVSALSSEVEDTRERERRTLADREGDDGSTGR
ncbi:MAG: hypothetical protein M1826_005560 [Phylliscum demangeonii]|nr:MAG: hypothetical protein M1826_005560 [Phylliscum demangeonii]